MRTTGRKCAVAALAAATVMSAAACGRSGVDRVAEGTSTRRPAVAGPPPAAPAPATTSAAPSSPAPEPSPADTATGGTGATPTAGPTASSSPAVEEGPAGEAFYDPPSPLPAGDAGTLLRQRPYDGADVIPGSARQYLVMYTTTGAGAGGGKIPATGIVTLPDGPAPEGGWPVVAWGHGTVGIAPTCASRNPSATPIADDDLLAQYVKDGYAVVRPDYVGMGVTGVEHPYLNGKSAAHATIDLVRAARTLDPGVGSSWLVAGHSQGGHAALWTAQYAFEYAPKLTLKGAVSVAPANGFDLMPDLVAAGDATAAPYVGIFLLMVDGASAADPAVKPEYILTPNALAAAEAAWTSCSGAETLPDPSDVVKPGADLTALKAYMRENSLNQVDPVVPVFLPQGAADPLVPMNATFAQTLCGRGQSVEYKEYPDQIHGPGEIAAAKDDIVAWTKARFDGVPATACAGALG